MKESVDKSPIEQAAMEYAAAKIIPSIVGKNYIYEDMRDAFIAGANWSPEPNYPTYEQCGGSKQWDEMTELERAYYDLSKAKSIIDVQKNTIRRLRQAAPKGDDVKSKEEIYRDRFSEEDTTEGYFITPQNELTLREEIFKAMEEYAAQFKPESIDKSNDAIGKPKIICLCGSTRFGQAFQDANLKETLDGKIVLSIGCNMKSDTEIFGHLPEGELLKIKEGLDELHKRKIDLCDEVFVLNVDGYIGQSTRSEINYAIKIGKPIKYLEPI